MTVLDLTKIKCNQPECKVAETGVCLEGLEIEKCTHKTIIDGQTDENILGNEGSGTKEKKEDDNLKFTYSGDALLIEETNIVVSSSLTRLVILAGNAKSGKTTLLASLFQIFQEKSSFAGYKFAGSTTLIGLEKRCYKSRIASQRDTPDTDRTVYVEHDEFIHLKVRKAQENKVDILFTDISGERFKSLSDSQDECKKFGLAKRADHFVLFIDAFLLSEPSAKHSTKTNCMNILRGLIESEMLEKNTYIEIVFSRWDLLLKRDNQDQHMAFVKGLKEEIQKKFSTSHAGISFHEVASRPDTELGLEFGHGIDSLLPIWVEKSPHISSSVKPINYSAFIDEDEREFLKFNYEG
jgi:energy-coupling factor transporter ATP-binding protein EcfA2